MVLGVVPKVAKVFSDFALRRPYIASGSIASVSLFGTDVATQFIFGKEGEKYDVRRGLSMATWGIVWYGGPQQWFWVKLYPRLFGGGNLTSAMSKTFADCVVNVMLFLIPAFYVVTGTVKGYTLEMSLSNLRSHYWDSCLGLSCFWLPVNFATFRFFPPHLQSYPIQVAQVASGCWLSWCGAQGKSEEKHVSANAKLPSISLVPRLDLSEPVALV